MDETQTSELLEFFKALGDANRLKIVGLLAREELAVEQIAAMLDLRPSTVSSHLSYLARAGLVSARAQSYYNVYRLEIGTLHDMARRLLSSEALQAEAAQVNMGAYDQKVIKNYTTPDGRIKQFPSQFKKMTAILRYVAREFDPGRTYTEKEVNELLKRFNDDTATLRRELVEHRILAREGGGGKYWLLEQADEG